MKLSLFVSTLLVCSSVFAAKSEAPPTVSLKEKALAEYKVDGLTQASATDAQVTGMLTLKDPRPEVVTRPWNYFAGISAQNFQPQGIANKPGSGTFNLSENNSTIMPGVEAGIISHALATGPVSWRLGLRAKAQLTSQATEVKLSSGFRIEDARLNTSLLSAGPQVGLQWNRLPWMALTLSPLYGNLTYTQTSANDFATFSKQAGFEAMTYGVDFSLNKKWTLFTEWSQRTLKDNNEIALEKDSFELGTRITW